MDMVKDVIFKMRSAPVSRWVQDWNLEDCIVRARYWHDYEYPGDVAHALVRAQLDHRKPPVSEPEQCPNRDCRVCHPSQEDADRLARGHHIK